MGRNDKHANSLESVSEKPSIISFLLLILFCLIFGFLLGYFVLFEIVKSHYCHTVAHRFGDIFNTGWRIFPEIEETVYTYTKKQVILFVILPAVLYATILHPLIGYCIRKFLKYLSRMLKRAWYTEPGESSFKEWNPDFELLTGAAWPISIIVTPCLGLGIILGKIYRLFYSTK